MGAFGVAFFNNFVSRSVQALVVLTFLNWVWYSVLIWIFLGFVRQLKLKKYFFVMLMAILWVIVALIPISLKRLFNVCFPCHSEVKFGYYQNLVTRKCELIREPNMCGCSGEEDRDGITWYRSQPCVPVGR